MPVRRSFVGFPREIPGCRELENLNALWAGAFGEPRFKYTDRPQGLGCLLRPSQREWEEFIVQLDQLPSDKIHNDGLDADRTPSKLKNDLGLGISSRQAAFLNGKGVDVAVVKDLMRPLGELRQARQKPTDALCTDITDITLVHRWLTLLEDLNDALRDRARWLSTHPKNRGGNRTSSRTRVTGCKPRRR